MYDVKSLLLFISLVVITIIRYADAEKTANQIECESLISDVWFSKEGDGITNFQLAFKNLSIRKLLRFYNRKSSNEESSEKQIRVLKRELNCYYFRDLFEHHNINFSRAWNIDKWCRAKYRMELEICKESLKEVFNIDIETPPETTFYIMYEYWTYSDLLRVYELRPHWPRNYPLTYFLTNKYETWRERLVRGSFRSVELFCDEIGQFIVLNKENL